MLLVQTFCVELKLADQPVLVVQDSIVSLPLIQVMQVKQCGVAVVYSAQLVSSLFNPIHFTGGYLMVPLESSALPSLSRSNLMLGRRNEGLFHLWGCSINIMTPSLSLIFPLKSEKQAPIVCWGCPAMAHDSHLIII